MTTPVWEHGSANPVAYLQEPEGWSPQQLLRARVAVDVLRTAVALGTNRRVAVRRAKAVLRGR